MTFEQQIQNYIGPRHWEDLVDHWIDHIPFLMEPAKEPEPSISQLIENSHWSIADQAKGLDHGNPIYDQLEGLRSLVFSEGLFLLHKAVHVLGNAETDLAKGIKTWAISEAYQASLFAIQATANFMGVALGQIQGNYFLIDVWPEKIREHNKEPRNIDKEGKVLCQIQLAAENISHKHFWLLYQRLIRICRVNFWPKDLVGVLSNIDTKLIPKQRNTIHYSNSRWIFSDLYGFSEDDKFGTTTKSLFNYAEKSDFSIVLATEIIRMGVQVLESLSEVTSKINGDLELMLHDLDSSRHPRYAIIDK